ncbi:MAG: hypothetical protein Q4B81_00075 [Moraxella sp.]|nr:hypothetical protein [Moraxella sp.]
MLNDCFVMMEQGVVQDIHGAMMLPLDFIKMYRQSPEWDKQAKRINEKRQLHIESLNRMAMLINIISKRL